MLTPLRRAHIDTALLLFALLVCAPVAFVLAAQCPNGSPPPCQRGSPPINSHLVAVLPFRVTTADTLLGEGFAELLAPEFTGEGAPRAVDMSTTLHAWRRAGGGLRTPLSQEAASRMARGIGAGLMSQGSIVGFGGKLTITAELYESTTGRTIGAPVRATGTAETVDTLLRRVAIGLLTNVAAETRGREVAELTTSPAALRSYFAGLALWRRGQWTQAERSLRDAVLADSLFAQAIYRLWLLTAQSGRAGNLGERLLGVRQRLSARARAVVEAFIVPPGPISLAERLAAQRRAAEELGDSPEAWFLYGDNVYHFGHAILGSDSAVTAARDAFSRALALDRQPVFLYHMMEIAVHQRDTTLLRQTMREYEGIEGEERWPRSWVAAAVLRDAAMLARLRQVGPDRSSTSLTAMALANLMYTAAPGPLVAEGYRRINALLSPPALDTSRTLEWIVHRVRGRAESAERALDGAAPLLFRIAYMTYAWVTGDVDDDEAVLRR